MGNNTKKESNIKRADAQGADKLAENFAKNKDCIVLMQSLIAFL